MRHHATANFSYLRTVSLVLLASLAGCATPPGYIKLTVPSATNKIEVEDQRDPNEVNGFGIGEGMIAKCTNHGKWDGIVEGAFLPSRPAYLQSRLGAELPALTKRVVLKRFQNCYQLNSLPRGAVFAAISMPLAIAVNSATGKGPDLVLAHIEVEIDGELFQATKTVGYQHVRTAGNPGPDYATKENAAATEQATDAAMGILIERIRSSKK